MSSFEQKQNLENLAEIAIMRERINKILDNPETSRAVEADFRYTFEQLGLPEEAAREMHRLIVERLRSQDSLPEIENQILSIFKSVRISENKDIVQVLSEKLLGRAKLIASQIGPYLENIRGSVIDYGTGDGQVAQILHKKNGSDIHGFDVRIYPAPSVTIPILEFDGSHIPMNDGSYEAAVLTNVLHHESQNEKILDEIDRLVTKLVVVIETVPVGETESEMEVDKDRTFMNDYLYNRLFHNSNVPVPGTFETPSRWKERFAAHGWKLKTEKDLGFDQPTIKDRHYLMIFEH
jgi:hypothetical protein